VTGAWSPATGSLDFITLHRAYADGGLTPSQVIDAVYDRIAARGKDPAWITLVPRAVALDAARTLESRADRAALPLFGLPLSVKDSFDIAGMMTTEGCRAYAYEAEATDPTVTRLLGAGAILIGKTNMDQFGVGINGTRTDYGIPRCVFDPDYISGGSTSGGGVTVAAGLVSLALGGDAAGSGRVPAALQNIVGLKPTPGLVSLGGRSPAGMSASHTVLTLTVADAVTATRVLIGYDPEDPLSRPEADDFRLQAGPPPAVFRFGVPSAETRIFHGDAEAERLFDEAIARLEAMGGVAVPLDYGPFLAVARMLYEDAFIARRYANLQTFYDAHEAALHPATRTIVGWGRDYSGADVFVAQHRLARSRRVIGAMMDGIDVLVTPTTPTTFTVAAMGEDNIALNAVLGTYTNFVNLLDMCAIAVPNGLRADGKPQGISFVGLPLRDAQLAGFAAAWERQLGLTLGATQNPLPLVSLEKEFRP
jgi:allophanate hydrolase